MAGNFSSLIGQVDDGIEQRSSLVAALRAKLGNLDDVVEPSAAEPVAAAPAEPLPPQAPRQAPKEPAVAVEVAKQPEPATVTLTPGGETFTNVMAQLDRGLDARQKLIDALKSQLCKDAALPKSAGAVPQNGARAAAEAPPWGGRRSAQAAPSLTLVQPLSAAPTYAKAKQPPAGPPAGFPGGEPAAKRPRTAAEVPGHPAAAGDPAQDALAARKAEMLRSLQGAEGTAGTPAQGPSAAPPAAGMPSMQPGMGGAGPRPPAPPAPPANATPEEFEAYRQQCWKQYYEYCAVWQKYYDQSKQGAKPEAKAATSKAKSVGMGVPTAPHGVPPNMPTGMPARPPAPPGLAPVPPPAAPPPAAGKGAGRGVGFPGAAPQARGLVEEDIHSKLLGL